LGPAAGQLLSVAGAPCAAHPSEPPGEPELRVWALGDRVTALAAAVGISRGDDGDSAAHRMVADSLAPGEDRAADRHKANPTPVSSVAPTTTSAGVWSPLASNPAIPNTLY